MGYLLTIDIGNTNITAGIFKGKRLAKKIKIPTNEHSLYQSRFKKFISGRDIKYTIVSSVVPARLPVLKKALSKILKNAKIYILGEDIKAPIRNLYRVKKQVGQDRLANAVAAKTIYSAPCVIIDFGTAITLDVVSKKGEYLGGLILPGIEISLSTLYEKTALLPKVMLAPSLNIIGKDTVNSMRGGILFGFGAMCDALVSRYRKMLGKSTKAIATGGNAHLMKRYAKSIQIIDEDLTLKGLEIIYKIYLTRLQDFV